MYTYKIHLHKETEGGFTRFCSCITGCITYGENLDEAISMAKEAVELYIEELREKRGEAIPDDSNTLEYSLTLETVRNLNPKNLIKILEQHGFVFKRSKGSPNCITTILPTKLFCACTWG